MNKVAEVVGWVTVWMLAVGLTIWLLSYTITSLFNIVFEDRPNIQTIYYWECRVSQDNPYAPWTQAISNKAKDPGSCGDQP